MAIDTSATYNAKPAPKPAKQSQLFIQEERGEDGADDDGERAHGCLLALRRLFSIVAQQEM